MKSVEVIQVVRTVLEVRGKGIASDPLRRVVQYWSLNGLLLAEADPERSDVRSREISGTPVCGS